MPRGFPARPRTEVYAATDGDVVIEQEHDLGGQQRVWFAPDQVDALCAMLREARDEALSPPEGDADPDPDG